MEGVGMGQQGNRFLSRVVQIFTFLASGAGRTKESITDNYIGKVVNVKLF